MRTVLLAKGFVYSVQLFLWYRLSPGTQHSQVLGLLADYITIKARFTPKWVCELRLYRHGSLFIWMGCGAIRLIHAGKKFPAPFLKFNWREIAWCFWTTDFPQPGNLLHFQMRGSDVKNKWQPRTSAKKRHGLDAGAGAIYTLSCKDLHK